MHATSVNRPDVVQRQGHYPPPPGESPLLGLEAAGTVEALGAGVTEFTQGERVFALLGGGGYAELAVAHAGHVMRIPPSLSFEQAACICETYLTAYMNVFLYARLADGETVLLHGGGGGVTTAAMQLVKALTPRARVLVTASTGKVERVAALGADVVIDYKKEDFAEAVLRHTDQRGVDVILDHLGGLYLAPERSVPCDRRAARSDRRDGRPQGRARHWPRARESAQHHRLGAAATAASPRRPRSFAPSSTTSCRTSPRAASRRSSIASIRSSKRPRRTAPWNRASTSASSCCACRELEPMTILRSLLFVPGNKANMLEKALGLTPDAFVPDMEDSVPAAEKANARATIASFLPRLAASGIPVIPRVNALDTEWIEDDLAAVVGPHIVGISVGKVRGAGDIGAISQLVGELERRAGSSVGTLQLMPWIETAEAIVNVSAICRASERIVAVAFGGEDFTNDMGVERLEDESQIAYARQALCVAARAAHVLALDTPYFKLRDPDGLRDNSLRAKSIGFKGRFAIHPEQIDGLNECFSPSAQEIAHAERVVAAFDEAERRGRASTSLDGWVIDIPVVKRARALLELARRARVER